MSTGFYVIGEIPLLNGVEIKFDKIFSEDSKSPTGFFLNVGLSAEMSKGVWASCDTARIPFWPEQLELDEERFDDPSESNVSVAILPAVEIVRFEYGVISDDSCPISGPRAIRVIATINNAEYSLFYWREDMDPYDHGFSRIFSYKEIFEFGSGDVFDDIHFLILSHQRLVAAWSGH